MTTRNCINCNLLIPVERINVLPNVRTCVNCSTSSKYTAVPVIHHKTGNEVQIVKNPDVAREFVRLSKRAGFGTLQSISSGKKTKSSTKFNSITISSDADLKTFNKIGEEALFKFELKGKEYALKFLNSMVLRRTISERQSVKIMNLIEMVTQPQTNNIQSSVKSEPDTVSEDIINAFKYWKR